MAAIPRTVTLNDGTVYNGSVGGDGNDIWVFVEDDDLVKILADFIDSEKTSIITLVRDELQRDYVGYTKFTAMMTDTPHPGSTGVKLRKVLI